MSVVPYCWDRSELERSGYKLVSEMHINDGIVGHGRMFKLSRELGVRCDQLVAYRLSPQWWGVFRIPAK